MVGVGNPLRGDDAVGPALVERLYGKIEADLLDVGEVPESYLSRITDLQPDTVLILDAVDVGAKPGSLAIIETSDLGNLNLSTHKMGLDLFMRYLQQLTGADVFMLGIQPQTTHLGEPLSPGVELILNCLESWLVKTLGGRQPGFSGMPGGVTGSW